VIEYGRFAKIKQNEIWNLKGRNLLLPKTNIQTTSSTRFIKNRTIKEQQTQASEQPKEQQQTAEKQKRYIVLPYSNHKEDVYAERLTKLVNDTFNQVELKVAFKASNEIGKLFSFKNNIKEKHAQSLVVYRLTCETCKQTYIGKTERILSHRIKEHLNLKKDSAIQTQLQENPTHVFDPENIEILDKATSNFKIRLKEELHIIT